MRNAPVPKNQSFSNSNNQTSFTKATLVKMIQERKEHSGEKMMPNTDVIHFRPSH